MWWKKEILKALKEIMPEEIDYEIKQIKPIEKLIYRIDLEGKDYRFVVILRLKPVEEAEEEEGTGRYKLLRYTFEEKKKGVKNAGAF
ncbi:MAG: hypothetical protein QW196_00275 [Sulfolobales archaeon]